MPAGYVKIALPAPIEITGFPVKSNAVSNVPGVLLVTGKSMISVVPGIPNERIAIGVASLPVTDS